MATRDKPVLSARFIMLDLIGMLLVVAGALEMTGMQLPGKAGTLVAVQGWTLVGAGAACMVLAGITLVMQLLAGRSNRETAATPAHPDIQTVQRRDR